MNDTEHVAQIMSIIRKNFGMFAGHLPTRAAALEIEEKVVKRACERAVYRESRKKQGVTA